MVYGSHCVYSESFSYNGIEFRQLWSFLRERNGAGILVRVFGDEENLVTKYTWSEYAGQEV